MNCGNKLKFPPHQQAARDDLLFGKMCISTHRDFSVLNQLFKGEKKAWAANRLGARSASCSCVLALKGVC